MFPTQITEVSMTDRPRLTTTAGAPLSSNQNAKTVGRNGPVLLVRGQREPYLESDFG